jgi:cytochrome o ubiquinol oxidase subunit IV
MKPSDAMRRDLLTYGTGYGLALSLTLGAFGSVYFRLMAPWTTLAVVLGLALIQVMVHLRFFLHIDLKRSARSDLQLILFSAGIILLMLGGTLVILGNLRMRMM